MVTTDKKPLQYRVYQQTLLIFAKNENMNNIIDINNVETKHFAVRD